LGDVLCDFHLAFAKELLCALDLKASLTRNRGRNDSTRVNGFLFGMAVARVGSV
jgi:hypothetical protein